MEEEKFTLRYKLVWVFFFAVWMAYVESTVVVYLREIYYPDGFAFPIILIPQKMALIELGRELATILMLLSIAFLSARRGWQRFAYFIYAFAVWDIWYYVWLKIFLDWPESLLTWDLLFLIPVPWSAPVLAPVIVSFSFIAAALLILYFENKAIRFHLKKWEWVLFISSPILIFISFIIDAPEIMKQGIPDFFHWELLLIGEFMAGLALFQGAKRLILKTSNVKNSGENVGFE